ncbi:phosphate/phosphite/phosphonate ABC transporter substrate-binding protein [Nesterenkonia sp. K-15-9-6]|uniref:phosphate/phosphite/phosphonate ABC transporter substrate-binding protein n=1 Tax=Nesterenkonia sp. K-15-9-6 TaxID=3093918 RepID=UPI004044F28F
MGHRGHIMRWTAGAAVAALGLTACGAGDDGGDAGDGGTLNFGVVPLETATETLDNWSFFIDKFEEETGYQIELFEATDPAAVIEATIAGDLDFVQLGPFAQWIARDNGAQLDTVGATAPDEQGPRNEAVAAVRADSGIEDITQLAGEDICFISPGSATGYLFGAAAFLSEGMDPERDVNGIFVGDHASAARSMYDGECAAVFTHREYAEVIFFDDNDDVEPGALDIIWRDEVPEGGISVSTEIDEELQTMITETILELNGDAIYERGECPDDLQAEGETGDFCRVMGQFWGIVSEDESYWEPIAEVCELTDAPACQS